MLLYKALNRDTRSVPLKVPAQLMVAEWHECWKDPNRDLSYFFQLLEPMIDHWHNMLTDKNYPKDINYLVLCSRIDNYFEQDIALEVLDTFNEAIQVQSELKPFLRLIIFKVFRQFKWFPDFARPQKAEFLLAWKFRERLRYLIIKIVKDFTKLDVQDFATTFNESVIEDEYIDILFLKNMDLTDWEQYLFSLRVNELPVQEIANICGIPRETFYYEERELCRKLKQTYYDLKV